MRAHASAKLYCIGVCPAYERKPRLGICEQRVAEAISGTLTSGLTLMSWHGDAGADYQRQ